MQRVDGDVVIHRLARRPQRLRGHLAAEDSLQCRLELPAAVQVEVEPLKHEQVQQFGH